MLSKNSKNGTLGTQNILAQSLTLSKPSSQLLAKLQDCHSVNGICLQDLEAFEAQLFEVKEVKASVSFVEHAAIPVMKTSVLGSRSAGALTKHPKNFNIKIPRLSLSCSSKMTGRISPSPAVSMECSIDSPQLFCDRDAVCLKKVDTLQIADMVLFVTNEWHRKC